MTRPPPERATPGPSGEVHELPFVLTSNRTARDLLSRFLREASVSPRVAQDAVIVIGELVANGLEHGCPDSARGLEVTWRVEGVRLRVSVRDGGAGTGRPAPRVMPPDPWASRGRGLAMVQALADSWWVEDDAGTRVTAIISGYAG